ncbi:isopenicillin N synthase family oxygenase [Cryobacterium frigoriphilum]|uniref:Isopenicillin N synthase family oxygenase n=1 Tax=Cryobacterium frigoriphilum TaxID=1259150 RepID=A0A4R9A7S5_9MICO|nr:2-oxoglutarate and iron-dependent oxygenase domain-containing protein [Cryobacterium frigoriphilum]TFD53549.1 isopenicillin N synthase family oxygenase [Cryobacterium frigoriphilum]
MSTLPVLDFSQLDAGVEAAARFRSELLRVTHEVGFFYLTGHGVDPNLTAELLRVSREFFDLPDEQKLALENIHSPQFRGYTRVGGELTANAVDWREQIDIGVDRPEVTRAPGTPDYWRLEGPNLWPESLPELEAVALRWNTELSRIALRLLRAWALALGSPEDVFDAAFASNPFLLTKIVRYPGQPERAQGVGEHRDGGVLTLLLVEPGKDGLQVEHDGEWIDAPPLENAFVVNIGEMLELATDGYLKATLHRVFSPVDGSDRISVPFFFNPALDTVMPRLQLPEELSGKARGLSVDPTDSPILPTTYGDNALRYRLRAHPNVASAHHADLL